MYCVGMTVLGYLHRCQYVHYSQISSTGVIARHPDIFPYLKSHVTAELVQKYFYHLIDPSIRDTPCVSRYDFFLSICIAHAVNPHLATPLL